MQQEPVHKDDKELRNILRTKIESLFQLPSSSSTTKDLIYTVEDYFWPSLVYFYLQSNQKDFKQYLLNIDLGSAEYLNVTKRVENFLNTILNEGITNAEKVLGDIHPYFSTKFLTKGKVKYRKYPDYYDNLTNLIHEIIPDYKKYLPSITREPGDFILREYIDIKKETNDENIIREYYYNLGRFIPILLLLRAIDINAENVIVNLPYPIFFDLESIFSGEFEPSIEKYSIKNTGIIKLTETDDSSVISGGIGIKNSYLKPIIYIKDGNPQIKWKVPSLGKYDNIPVLKGSDVKPNEYLDKIVNGFRDTVQKILLRKNPLSSLLDKNVDTFTRVILRPTRVYRLMILKSFYPQIYLNQDLLSFFNEELSNSRYLYDVFPDTVVTNEINSVSNLLVPVFYSNIFGKEILFPNDKVVGKFRISQYDVWQKYLNNVLNEEFFIKQKEILTESVKEK